MNSLDVNANPFSDWIIERFGSGVVNGNGEEHFRLRFGVNSIGRHSASDLKIDSVLVSRNHAEITIPENTNSPILLRDLYSINGTYINQLICRANIVSLYENDIISFGAEFDDNEDDASELPVYVLKFKPLHPPPPVSNSSNILEIVISDDEEDAMNQLDFKPPIPPLSADKIAVGNILTIFGNADETILNGLQRINPIVCEAVKQTSNAELIELSSDDEEEKQQQKFPAQKSSDTTVKSPQPCNVIELVENDEQKRYESESEESNWEENQLIYSQALLNEMKSEMVDESDESGDENTMHTTTKRKLLSPPVISLIDDDDDGDNEDRNDDEFDEDFEKSVSSWTDKLFTSQIFPKLNCSQTLISNTTIDEYSSNDELVIPMHYKNADTVSDNTLIENLFEQFEDKFESSNNGDRETPKKRKYAEKSRNVDITNSPVIKTKKRRIMKVVYSDESSDDDESDEVHLKKKEPLPNEVTKDNLHNTPNTPTKKLNRRAQLINAQHIKVGKKGNCLLKQQSNQNNLIQNKTEKNTYREIKEIRRERLKTISTNKSNNINENCEASTTKSEEEPKKSTSKVKNTIKSRSAFLCEMDETSTSVASKNEEKPCVSSSLVNSNSNIPPPEVLPLNFFSQEESTLNKCITEVKKVIRKNAEKTRSRNAPKKLRFSEVDKNFEKQLQIKERTNELTSKLIPNATTQIATAPTTQQPIISTPPVDIPAPDIYTSDENSVDDVPAKKPKKTVRFNDVPTIHYFESHCQFLRKVDGKDVMPHFSYRHRRGLIRRTYPTIDRTDNILSLILSYSNEWLAKTSPGAFPIPEDMTPFPTTFESFEHYKRIVFPLMKLEYMSNLQREMEANAKAKPINFILDDIIENKERVTLITKRASNGGPPCRKKIDLILLTIGELQLKAFAFMVNSKKFGTPGDRYNSKYFFEIMPNSIDAKYLRKSKFITMQPAIENLQVTIGAYNAIYQLQMTPLCEMLLNPKLLLNPSSVLQTQLDEDIAPEVKHEDLNTEQLNAVKEIYKKILFNKTDTTPNISLIQGPPGTGKSVVIVNLALQLIYGLGGKFRDKKIIICAQSNCAIDLVAAKLLEARSRIQDKKCRFTLVRFGIFEKMHSKVHRLSLHNLLEFERVKKLSYTLSGKFSTVLNWKNHLHKLQADVNALQLQAKTNIEVQTRLDEKKREIEMLHDAYKNALTAEEEHKICKKYLGQCNIICTTLSSCVKLFQWIDYFDVCIIDEATQCTEPWTLLPLKFGISSLVLVGDSQQLPATVLSKQATEYGLTRSLFTRIENSIVNDCHSPNHEHNDGNVIFRLRIQYRMLPEICKFPNSFFYKNMLMNAESTLKNKTCIMPYSVFNLDYAQSKSSGQGKIINQLEADFIVELLKALNEYIPIEKNTYGVITPYAHQRQILANTIQNARLPHVTVNTIDSYQGVEKDVIVISNARTNGVGFLANPQRLNVAITRPKKCLILCGNFRNLQYVPAWRCLLQDAQQRNVYYEISTHDKSNIKTKVIQRILVKN